MMPKILQIVQAYEGYNKSHTSLISGQFPGGGCGVRRGLAYKRNREF